MGEIEYTVAAVEDIIDAGVESLVKWGPAQKERYIENLRVRLNILATFPFSAPARPDIGPAYRSTPCGAHVIYYIVIAGGIRVIRFLPGARDPARHLLTDPLEYRIADR